MSEEFDDDEELEQDDDFDDDELEGEPCPFCSEPNHPPSDTLCIHNVAWTWDGQIEALGSATQLARQDVGLAEVLQQLAGATASGGWSTNGMLGGSGDCLYVRDPAQVAGLAAQCKALCRMD